MKTIRNRTMKKRASIFALIASLGASLPVLPANAGPPNDANGASKRPFYIVGHNPNDTHSADFCLSNGANALEPDITFGYTSDLASQKLRVFHDNTLPTAGHEVVSLVDYCDHLNEKAKDTTLSPGLALVVFDVKCNWSDADSPAYGDEILDTIRNHLNKDGVKVNVILSVGTQSDGHLFDNIRTRLGPREGILIDSENDVNGVVGYFRGTQGYTANIAYADGTTASFPSGYYYMEHAAFRRSQYGLPKSIPYVFALALVDSMKEYITTGVDGIIPIWLDNSGPASVGYYYYPNLTDCVDLVKDRGDIRMATREDNPFQPKNEAYALYITTQDGSTYGTDANITFTLTGANGSSNITVDTYRDGRMESGNTNYVTIPSKDLGPLTTIKIKNDNSGSGPDWRVGSIQVTSARWLGPGNTPIFYNVTINDWINGDDTDHAFPLTQQNSAPYANAWADSRVPAHDLTADPTGEFTKPWQDFFSGYNLLRPNGTLRLGAGTYREFSRLDKPCRITKESAAPYPSSGNARLVYPSNP
jgi:hypothetical protein